MVREFRCWQVYWRSILAVVDCRFKAFKTGKIIVVAATRAELKWAFDCAVEDLFGEGARVVGLGITQYPDNGEAPNSEQPGLTDVIRGALEEYYEQELQAH